MIEATLEVLRKLHGAFLDPWAVVDLEGTILDSNRHFRGLFPKSLGRKAKGSPFDDYVMLEWGDRDIDIVQEIRERGAPVRYDEVTAYITDGLNLSMIVAASPLNDDTTGAMIGAMIVLRDVTDLVKIQSKYRRLSSGAYPIAEE